LKSNLSITNTNTDSVKTLQEKVERNGNFIDEIVDEIVNSYCVELDNYMYFIKSLLDNGNNVATNKELDDIILNIPVLLYFIGSSQEALGIKEDVAKALKQEVYNESYGIGIGTTGDKTSFAELQSQNENVMHIAYQRAYKKVKLKMEAANETLQSAKKVISRRMAEYDLSKISTDRNIN